MKCILGPGSIAFTPDMTLPMKAACLSLPHMPAAAGAAEVEALLGVVRFVPADAAIGASRCATKRIDGMGGNPLRPYQGAGEPLGLSTTGRADRVSSMP